MNLYWYRTWLTGPIHHSRPFFVEFEWSTHHLQKHLAYLAYCFENKWSTKDYGREEKFKVGGWDHTSAPGNEDRGNAPELEITSNKVCLKRGLQNNHKQLSKFQDSCRIHYFNWESVNARNLVFIQSEFTQCPLNKPLEGTWKSTRHSNLRTTVRRLHIIFCHTT